MKTRAYRNNCGLKYGFFGILGLGLIFLACSNDAAPSVSILAVTGVTVNPSSASVLKGGNKQFTAGITGINSPAQTVTWTVEGGGAGTSISNGKLIVAANETAASLTVRATSTADTGKSGTAIVTVIAGTLPPLTGSVSITGTAQAGLVLTANTASLEGSGTISYQWTRGDSSSGTFNNIFGAASSTYTLVTDDAGKYIKVTVTRTGYSGSITSAAVGAVLPAQAETPTVTSVTLDPANASVLKGETQRFTATVTGENSPAQTVTWSVTGGISETIIAEDGTLTVASGETAESLTVRATSTVDTGKSGTATVTVIAVMLPPLTGSVSITGTAQAGLVLTANTGSLEGSGTISYQWLRGDSSSGTFNNIFGAASSTYTLVADDVGKYIKVTVTRSGNTGSVDSSATAQVTFPALTGSVTISGTTTVGQTLTANTNSLGGSGTISYQWKRGDSSGAAGTDISGAVSSTYKLVTADAGKYIKVTVTRAENTGSVNSNTLGAIQSAEGPPTITTTPLDPNASGVQTYTSNSGGNKSLPGSPYGYEMWTEGGNNNKLIWYGPNQGGGAAFRAEWNNPNDFLGRVGYYWGKGGPFTQYKNMYADFNYTRSGRNTAGNYSYIGIYGWARNPDAADPNERLIEYYIVEDWFGNQWQADTTPMGTGTTGGSVVGSYTLDGATYSVIKNVRVNKPSIDGDTTFTQYFSIRQTLRKTGTISITEHFKKWDGMNMKLGNMYEVKFLVEAGGGTGWLEFTYLKLSQEDNPR
ncbi:MAG: glycoside hydrolase family 11 protein [Spirochaetaceae bacterium]|jgi:endo-1,4-beta-xylanase|nr:glycoside hydrolase family 11 protein [Spirochaetaceae bacterium]